MPYKQIQGRAPLTALQVVTSFGEEIELREDNLRRVLEHPYITNAPRPCEIAIFNIAGSAREGKSFILNLFIEFLYAEQAKLEGDTNANWRADGTRFRGFHFINSCKSDTMGIWMWAEPIMLPLGSRLLAVILMDTQGLFDATFSKEVSQATYSLFSLSSLISSVQVFNIMKKIEEPFIAFYQMLLQFGEAVSTKASGEKAFQTMYLMVRDWANSQEYAHGLQSDGRFLRERGAKLLETSQMFERAGCILLPMPEIAPEFLDCVGDAAAHMISSGELCGKKLNGQLATGSQLIQYIKAMSDCIGRNKKLLPADLVSANAQIAKTFALQAGISRFHDAMKEAKTTEEAMTRDSLENLYKNAVSLAVEEFWSAPRAKDVCKNDDELGLREDIKSVYKGVVKLNDARLERKQQQERLEELATETRLQKERMQQMKGNNKTLRKDMERLQSETEKERQRTQDIEKRLEEDMKERKMEMKRQEEKEKERREREEEKEKERRQREEEKENERRERMEEKEKERRERVEEKEKERRERQEEKEEERRYRREEKESEWRYRKEEKESERRERKEEKEMERREQEEEKEKERKRREVENNCSIS